jgi:hypothetical protein
MGFLIFSFRNCMPSGPFVLVHPVEELGYVKSGPEPLGKDPVYKNFFSIYIVVLSLWHMAPSC